MRQLTKSFSLSACALAASLLISACGGGSETDLTPPTITITDSVSDVSANGAVTFSFEFSKDVGTSFVIEDLVINGGTFGALNKIDAKHYTLVITPAENTVGTINVSIAAGKFKDIALNDNTAPGSASQVFDTRSSGVIVLATFDEATPPAVTEFGGAGYAVAASPTGGSANALKIVRNLGEAYAGAWILLGTPIPSTSGTHTVTARVYSPTAGVPFVAKAEFGDNQGSGDVQPTTTVVQGWQTLTWNFTNLDSSKTYNRFTILPTLGAVDTDKSYYIDDIKLVGETSISTPTSNNISISFDEATPPAVTEFGGAGYAVAASPTGGSANALKIVRNLGEAYAGAWILLGTPIPSTSGTHTVTARVYSPTAGVPFVAKAEFGDNQGSGDVQPTTTVVQGWQTLTWNFTNLDSSKTYNRFTILPNLGAVDTDKSYYIDDISFDAGSAVSPTTSCTPTGLVANTFASFDSDCAGLTKFGGVSAATVEVDPTSGTNKVAKVVRPATDLASYAGVTVFTTSSDKSIGTIPFSSSKLKMTLRVYAPAVGIRVRLKVENAGNTNINTEVDAFTTVANAWETLTFDFVSTDPTHFIPNGPSTYNSDLPTSQWLSTNTYNKASIFFDYGLGDGGYAAMPAARTYYFDDLKYLP